MRLSSSVKARLLALGLGLTLIPLAVVMVLTVIQQNESAGIAGDECKDLNLISLDRIARSVYALCESQDQVLGAQVTSGLRVTRHALDKLGPVAFADETVSWQAVNQFSKSQRTVNLPKMLAGETWLGQNASAGRTSPVVDEVGQQVGGVSTIFQRMNPEGDMLRVCTNVMQSDGTRALGTFIPATDPDGKPNPIVSKVLKGDTYNGRAYVLDRWYLTAYEPLRDGGGKVVGINCFGVPMESATALRQAVLGITIAETGYVYVVDSKGDYVISQDGKRDGENIWDAKDSDGVAFIQEIVAKAKVAPAGEVFEQLYPWKNSGDTKARLKVARCIYYEPWDWVIGASSYMDEFTAAERRIQANGKRNILIMGLIVLAAVLAGTGATILISGRITGPLRQAVEVADRVARGDLTVRLNMTRKDEVGTLALALDRMSDVLQHQAQVATAIADGDLTVQPRVASKDDAFGQALLRMCQRLNEALGGVRQAAISVSAGSREISDSSTSLSQGATEQAASLQEITSSLTELSSRVQVNAKNAEQADNLSHAAQDSAATGVDQMQSMSGAMGDISQSSEEIAKIIKVIDDIAFQTNLLALNAAVEAARAGKHGKGFAVVAEEVRNLAGRSAKAARETAQLIEGSLGKVERGTAMAADTLASLQSIVASVTKASNLVGEIASASREQALALTEISQGLGQIDSVTQQNTANSEETASAAQELSGQATELQGLLARFKLNAKETNPGRALDPVAAALDFELEPVGRGW